MEDNKQNITDSEIQDKASSLKSLLGGEKNFDEEKFRADIDNMKNSDRTSLHSLDAEAYRKKDENDNYSNSDGLSFKGFFKDGMYTAVGPNGKTIKSKDFADFNRQLAAEFIANAKEKGKDPHCNFETADKDPKKMKTFAREFINAGVMVSGDLPNDPKFWNGFRQDYLKKSRA